MKTLAIAGILLALSSQSMAQPVQDRRPLTMPKAIRVEVAGIDSEAAAFGFTSADVIEALRMAAQAGGWDVEAGSEFLLSAKVSIAKQRQEDMTTFLLTVGGGTEAPQTVGITGGFRMESLVDIPAGQTAKAIAQLTQVATKVAQRFRQDLMRRAFQKPRKAARTLPDYMYNPYDPDDENYR